MIIVVEGIDGCGKTSVVEALAKELAARQTGMTVAKVAFPNRESPTGRLIDSYLRTPAQFVGMDAYAHEALQVVNRLELLTELRRGDRLNVLSRYTPSGLVYGALDGCNEEWLRRVSMALPPPDLCVLLACDPHVAYRRMCARGVTADQYERRGAEWFARAADLYDRLWATQPMTGVDHDECGTVWLRLATEDPPEKLGHRLAEFFMGVFKCRCGLVHSSARTPCRDEENENGDEE